MKKILVASPVRGGLSPAYVRATIALLNSTLCRGKDAPYAIDFAWTSGTSVAMARDEIANLLLRRGDDEIVFWDIDLGVNDPQMMVSMFNRLLSHDVDIVGGAYVGHGFPSKFHGAAHDTNQTILPNGLIKMAQIPLGFSKTKKEVFHKIKSAYPYLEYVFKETEMEAPKAGMFEFFPNGVVGPNTGQGKVDRIKKAIKTIEAEYTIDLKQCEDLSIILKSTAAILEIVNDNDYSQNVMLGEDFYFCRLAREAGVELFIDNNLIVPHSTDVRLPVKNQMLLNAIAVEWRWEGGVKSEEVFVHLNALRKMLIQEIL